MSCLLTVFGAGPSIAAPIKNSATKYAVVNPNPVAIIVSHKITNTEGFEFSFTSTVPASGTSLYKLGDMVQVPSPFSGTVYIESEMFFQAHVVGYEWSGSPTVK